MTTGKPILSNLKDLVLCRELVYGTSNMLSTEVLPDGGAAVSKWGCGAQYDGYLIEGGATNRDGTFMVGCLITAVSGTAANLGLTRRITGFTYNGGADSYFTCSPDWPAAPQANDTAYIYKPFRAKLNTMKLNIEKLPRDYHTSSYERPSPVVGKNSGELDFTTEFICDHINNSPTTYCKSVTQELFEACFGAPYQMGNATPTTVAAPGGGETATSFALTDATNLVAKGMIAIKTSATQWDIRQLATVNTTTGAITLTSPISSGIAPLGGEEVYKLYSYRPADIGTLAGTAPGAANSYETTRSVTIAIFKNNQLLTFTGCVGNVKTELTPAGLAELTFALKADTCTNADGFTATQQLWKDGVQFHSLKPPANLGGAVYNASAAWIATKLSFDAGLKTIEKPIFTSGTGRSRFSNVGRDPKCSATLYNLSNSEMLLFTANTTVGVFAQMGNPLNAAGGFAISLEEAILSDIQPSDMEGCEMYDATIQSCDDNSQASAINSRMTWAWFNDTAT